METKEERRLVKKKILQDEFKWQYSEKDYNPEEMFDILKNRVDYKFRHLTFVDKQTLQKIQSGYNPHKHRPYDSRTGSVTVKQM